MKLAPVGFSFVRSRETRSSAKRALLWAVLQGNMVSWELSRVAACRYIHDAEKGFVPRL